MYNFYNKQLPVIFSEFFYNFNLNLYKFETRQRYKLHTPKFKTNLGQETVKYTGALILNDVMSISDFSNDKSIFRKSIRQSLIIIISSKRNLKFGVVKAQLLCLDYIFAL